MTNIKRSLVVALVELSGGDIAVAVGVAVVECSREGGLDCFWAMVISVILGKVVANTDGIIKVELAVLIDVVVDELTNVIHGLTNVDILRLGLGLDFDGRGTEEERSEGEEFHFGVSLCFVY